MMSMLWRPNNGPEHSHHYWVDGTRGTILPMELDPALFCAQSLPLQGIGGFGWWETGGKPQDFVCSFTSTRWCENPEGNANVLLVENPVKVSLFWFEFGTHFSYVFINCFCTTFIS